MASGTLYGVGVGPGDPKLLTLRAVEIIAACPVVAAPRTGGKNMVALEIARGAVDLTGKTLLPLDFAMSRDAGAREAAHAAAAERLREHLSQGRDVALLNLGDVSLYASFRYMAERLSGEGYPIAMIPGVPSFCAAAAALGTNLADMTSPISIVPDAADAAGSSRPDGTTIWMKSGRRLRSLLERLRDDGLLGGAMLVQNCGMPNQKVFRGVAGAKIEPEYFSLVILKNGMGEAGR